MSTIAEELHRHHGESCAEQKLKVVRAELIRPVLTVQSAVALLKQIDPELVQRLPESISPTEFENVITWLDQAAEDLKEIVNALAADCGDADIHPAG